MDRVPCSRKTEVYTPIQGSAVRCTDCLCYSLQPVHKWMVRHIYFPCLRNGIPKVIDLSSSSGVHCFFRQSFFAGLNTEAIIYWLWCIMVYGFIFINTGSCCCDCLPCICHFPRGIVFSFHRLYLEPKNVYSTENFEEKGSIRVLGIDNMILINSL